MEKSKQPKDKIKEDLQSLDLEQLQQVNGGASYLPRDWCHPTQKIAVSYRSH